jgi:hypothetical protein
MTDILDIAKTGLELEARATAGPMVAVITWVCPAKGIPIAFCNSDKHEDRPAMGGRTHDEAVANAEFFAHAGTHHHQLCELAIAAANLLARIHRDGGDYLGEHGWRKAFEDADTAWAGLMTRIDELESLIVQVTNDRDELRKALKAAALCEPGWLERAKEMTGVK